MTSLSRAADSTGPLLPQPLCLITAKGERVVAAQNPRVHAALFLRLLTLDVPDERLVHVWGAVRAADGRLRVRRRPLDTHLTVAPRSALADRVLDLHAAGLEVFAGVLPRLRPELGRGAVAAGRLVWMDVDDPSAAGALADLCAEHPPHFRGFSGRRGEHLLWRIDADHAPALLARAGARLAARVGGDPAVAHPGACLRVPGTRNRKQGGRFCRALLVDLHRPPYSLKQLVGTAELEPQLAPSPTPTRRPVGPVAADALRALTPPEYVRRLAGIDVGEQGGWICCPLPDHDDIHPSCLVYADTDRGWCCFSHPGGPLGGRVYDLASALAGGPTGRALHGRAFLDAKRWAAERLR